MTFTDSIKLVLSEHIVNIKQIISMAKNDLKKEYSGTALSYFWAVIKNLIYVFAYWFAMAIGLKHAKETEYPYMVWLVAGLTAWFLIKDTLAPAAKSIRKNKYLVTKMIYPISTIPTFKVLSSFMSNLMFLGVLFLVAIIYGVNPSIYWIQIIYYQFAAVILLIGISLLTSALVVVSRDIEMIINSSVFMIFWFSPILYPVNNLSGALATLVKLNPFYYIIEGFRSSILYKTWFFYDIKLTVYFWVLTIIILVMGIFIHGKLRNQFVDIL